MSVARLRLRVAAVLALAAVSLGTSCIGPSVYVFQRFALSKEPDSAYVVPATLVVSQVSFSQPAPKAHWWSDEPPRPTCRGFTPYLMDRLPRDFGSNSFQPLPPYELEM